MKRIQMILICVLTVATTGVFAQDFKFGKVSKDELEEKWYPRDSSVSAAVLYRAKKIRFVYAQSMGFSVVTNVHERIKIYTKEGFDYATVSQLLYRSDHDKESLASLKGYTYNLIEGKIEKTKMGKSAVFSSSVSKSRDEEKFTLPNITEGSVLEYQYQISSPFYYSIDEIDLQLDIPIKKQEITVETPEYFVFKPIMKGYITVSPKYGKKSGKIQYTTRNRTGERTTVTSTVSSQTIDYSIDTASFSMQDVPALKDEPYVNNINNYRSAVNYELQYVKFPREPIESYTSTWGDVVSKIYKSDNFGGQLKLNRYFKEDLEELMGATSSDLERIAVIFQHVQRRMNWNNVYGYYTDKGVKEAYKERTGNIADINLILTAMLQEAGLDASPVLVSTRSHGVPMFPTREGFNYVIASVDVEGETLVLDATNKYTMPNLLPTRALNWFGKKIKRDGTFETLNLNPSKISRETCNISVSLAENGTISGKERKILAYYDSYIFRNKYAQVDEEDYLEKFENDNSGMEISEYEIKNKKAVGKPVIEVFSFDLENQADVVGDKIYFSPMFYVAMTENPFKLDTRYFPVDFTFPWQEKYNISIEIPEGYQVSSKPEDINIVLPNKIGGFRFQIADKPGVLQVVVDLRINETIIPVDYYAALKELFKNVVEKETEKVVLSKI